MLSLGVCSSAIRVGDRGPGGEITGGQRVWRKWKPAHRRAGMDFRHLKYRLTRDAQAQLDHSKMSTPSDQSSEDSLNAAIGRGGILK